MATTTKSRVRFQERAELLDFLLEVSAITAETLDLDRLLENVAEIVRRVIPHELFAILLYSERRKTLTIRHAVGHREEVIQNLQIPLGEGVTGVAARERRAVVVGDVREERNYLNALDAVRSEMAVPMVARHKLVGVIDLESTAPKAFSGQDRALLQLIAGRVGAAIDNARLYRRVDRQNRTQRTLTRLAQEFSSILRLDKLLDEIAKSMHALINYDAFVVLQVDAPKRQLRSLFSLRYDQRVQLESLPIDKGITGAAASSGQPVLARDTLSDPRYVESHPGIRSEVAVPLIVKDRVIGVMDLESEHVGAFTEDHVRALQLIAPQIAIAIENARLYEELERREKAMQQDLEAARQLQNVLLPPHPLLVGIDTGIGYKPARTVSGDVYDFFDYDGESSMVVFGDSSGKGAAAALYGAVFNGLVRSIAPRRRSPALLLAELNVALMERQVEARFLTLLAMLWQSRERRFTIANAGSTTPLICRAGKLLNLQATGLPVGLLERAEYDEIVFPAGPGDVILLYSDGVSDQPDAAGAIYGDRRLAEFFTSVAARPAAVIAAAILEDIVQFRGTAPMHDDQTVIVLKVN
ncbi:MAG: GAF domain-containing protein [Bryobacteraceae bacterium]